MISMTGFDLPPRSMRQQIASAIDVVIQLTRFEDGTRRVVSLHEVTGMEGEIVTMQEIFAFQRTGTAENGAVRGHFAATGIRPTFMDTLSRHGVELSSEIFAPNRRA